jgi:hypothetical protein
MSAWTIKKRDAHSYGANSYGCLTANENNSSQRCQMPSTRIRRQSAARDGRYVVKWQNQAVQRAIGLIIDASIQSKVGDFNNKVSLQHLDAAPGLKVYLRYTGWPKSPVTTFLLTVIERALMINFWSCWISWRLANAIGWSEVISPLTFDEIYWFFNR